MTPATSTQHWARLALGLLLLLAGHLALRGYVTDDTYIHLRYAENLLAHAEFSFNPGESTYGATSPLWILGLAGFLPDTYDNDKAEAALERGDRRRRLLTLATEHRAVLDPLRYLERHVVHGVAVEHPGGRAAPQVEQLARASPHVDRYHRSFDRTSDRAVRCVHGNSRSP
mgnify:CR=1 FL=1